MGTLNIIIINNKGAYNNSNATIGECIALWGEPNELSIQYRIYILIIDS